MQGVAAQQGAGGPPPNFNRGCLLAIDLKEIVDVAKAGGTDGQAILQIEKLTAGAGAGERRRADGRKVFLARTAHHPNTGNAHQGFVQMIGPNLRQRFAVDDAHAAGIAKALLNGAGDNDLLNEFV